MCLVQVASPLVTRIWSGPHLFGRSRIRPKEVTFPWSFNSLRRFSRNQDRSDSDRSEPESLKIFFKHQCKKCPAVNASCMQEAWNTCRNICVQRLPSREPDNWAKDKRITMFYFFADQYSSPRIRFEDRLRLQPRARLAWTARLRPEDKREPTATTAAAMIYITTTAV